MSRSARHLLPSLRTRSLVVVTSFFIIIYLALRPSDQTSEFRYKDDRLSHLLPDRPDTEHVKGFSPIKALGLHEWVPGQRKRLLIVGGASPLAQSLIPELKEEYEIYVYDKPQRPSSLPISPHIHYQRSSTRSLSTLLSQYTFSGVIEMNGIDLSEKCSLDTETCLKHYTNGVDELLGSTGQMITKKWWKGVGGSPWIVLATEAAVRSESSGSASYIDKIQREVEDHLKSQFKGSTSGPNQTSKGAIARFSTIYGYPPQSSTPDTFAEATLVNSAISASTILDSDLPPLDLVHVNDAVRGLLSIIRSLDSSPIETSLDDLNFVSGEQISRRDFVDLVRRQAGSKAPLKDIGNNQARQQTWVKGNYRVAETVFGWRPRMALSEGIRDSLKEVHRANIAWASHYIETECSTTSLDLTPASAAKIESNIKNRDLSRLNGCSVNIAFDRQGFLDYVKCPGNSTECNVDNVKVPSYNWGADVFVIKQQGRGKQDRRVTVSFEEEKGRGVLGIPLEGKPVFGLYNTEASGARTIFDIEVQPDQSNLRFTIPVTGQQIMAVPDLETNTTQFRLSASLETFDARFNILCCPVEGDWPLLEDDFETADIRFGSTGDIPFNASRRSYTCQKAEEAVVHAQTQLHELETELSSDMVKDSNLPVKWAMKDLPVCWNDCSSPTVCVYTGSCRCVQAECPSKRTNTVQPVQSTDKGTSKSVLGALGGFSPNLVQDVKNGNWTDILLPSFRQYIEKHQSFPSLHVVSGYKGEESIESAECHKLAPRHCFSADNILYRAMRHLSVPAEEADLIVLPVYQHCEGTKFLLHDVMHHAAETIPGIKENKKKVAIVLTHDWGICIAFAWEMWSARENHRLYPDWILNNMLVWSVMGDYDSPCYRPQQDIVIPPRTCPTPLLRETFQDIKNVMPSRDRPKLVTWAGTYWGTGKSERLRMTCERGGAGDRELVTGGGSQSVWYNWDYMKSLGTARFCPQPRGIAGWSPRVNDAIYAGCIPVLTAEGTHYPLSSALDWTKFSIRLLPTDLDRLEEILESIPIDKVEEMQKNLMLVREGFLYSTDEHPEDELERRGPMFWALHSAGLMMGVEYPTA